MRFFLVFILLFQFKIFAKSLRNEGRVPSSFKGNGELYYNKCVSSLYNHPHFLKASGGVEMGDQQQLMLELDQYCLCHAVEDVKQQQLYKSYRMGFFFLNKKEHLASLDICLQEKVSSKNRREFFQVMSSLKLSSIVTNDLTKLLPNLNSQLASRLSNGPSKECIEDKLVKACKENSSLYFLYRCLKRKLKDSNFFDQSYATCSEFTGTGP